MAEASAQKSKEEEFYYLLTEGSEHLQAGRVDDARQHFERALLLNESNEQALNLLGLSLFRLGQLDRARQIFNDLVHNNPIEPSLRLNLAMVFLKMARLDDAHTELDRVLDLNPDHPRAASYMGLVLEKKGQLDRAADFYERAGNKKRADEIRAFRPSATGTFPIPNLAAMGVSQAPTEAAPGPAAMARAAASAAPAPAPTKPPPRAATPAPQAGASVAPASVPPVRTSTQPLGTQPLGTQPLGTQPQAPSERAPASRQVEAAALTAATAQTLNQPSAPPPADQVESARGASMGYTLDVGKGKAPAPDKAASTADKADRGEKPPPLKPAPAAVPQPVLSAAPNGQTAAPSLEVREEPLASLSERAVDGRTLRRTAEGHLVFPITDVGYVRTDLLAGLSGAFEVEVVNRRYRGKRTDSLFGGAEAAVVALLGKGFALLGLGDVQPTALGLTNEELYLVEGSVVGFSAGLVWENGRLPSEADRDLDIVHLRGSGRVVLGTKKPVLTLPVQPDSPVVVHAAKLVGWTGQLVPFRAPLPGLPENARRVPIVRFEGTGTVLST